MSETTLEGRVDRMASAMDTHRDQLSSLMVSMESMQERMTLLVENPLVVPDQSELYKALIAAQLEIKNADQNVDNEFLKSKYADLASVMDAVREPLAKNGLTIIQLTATITEVKTVEEASGAIGIKTILAHEAGQTIVDIIAMVPPKMDPQGTGSCRTYMRRYAVLAICAIAGAIDDDAEGAKKDADDYDRITTAEAEKILMTADELFGDRADAVLNKMLDRIFSVTRVGDIKSGEAKIALTNLQNAKKTMDKVAKKETDKTSPKPPVKEREPGADDDKE